MELMAGSGICDFLISIKHIPRGRLENIFYITIEKKLDLAQYFPICRKYSNKQDQHAVKIHLFQRENYGTSWGEHKGQKAPEKDDLAGTLRQVESLQKSVEPN